LSVRFLQVAIGARASCRGRLSRRVAVVVRAEDSKTVAKVRIGKILGAPIMRSAALAGARRGSARAAESHNYLKTGCGTCHPFWRTWICGTFPYTAYGLDSMV
jgi:hypothetical protein